ncbi:hypothetical protein RCH09_003654 [Actimicrobium sp. GrIS 1.19]|uniref:hypothetical protein n=1 Tax=Actimicrobium sp. GrIS 1.19 TaxID=3071708 RepID=UPI002E089F3F|nr:hypothetical protein [Actimicrobium sp. GrIS 1.19]
MRCFNINLHSSGQLWSNTALRYTAAGIAPMLVNPAFLDLALLATKFSCEKVAQVNDELLGTGEITPLRHQITASMLLNIGQGMVRSAEAARAEPAPVVDLPAAFLEHCVALAERVEYRDLLELWMIIYQGGPTATVRSIFETIQRHRPQLPYEYIRYRLLDSTVPDAAVPAMLASIRSSFRLDVNAMETEMAAMFSRGDYHPVYPA